MDSSSFCVYRLNFQTDFRGNCIRTQVLIRGGAFQFRGDYTNLTPLTPLSSLKRGERTAGSAPISPRQVPDVSNRREGFRVRANHCPIGAPSPTAVTVGEGGAGVTLGVRVGVAVTLGVSDGFR